MDLLFVCTGNACRSPLAERLLRGWQQRWPTDGDLLEVVSAGTGATAGRPMDADSARALTELGGDATDFASRRLDVRDVARAGLVLTMTRDQRRTVLASVPMALKRTFTVLEAAALVPLADLSGLEQLPLRQRPRALALRLSAARSRRSESRDDDVPDPIGRPFAVHQEVAAQIATALRVLERALLQPGAHAPPIEGASAQPVTALPRPLAELVDDRAGRVGWRVGALVAALVVLLIAGTTLLTRPSTPTSAETAPRTTAPAPSAPPLSLPLPPDPQLMVLGDATTHGVGAQPQSAGWAYEVAVMLGWRTEVHGYPGSGFTTATDINPRTFAQRIADLATRPFVPNVLVLQGGALDAGATAAAISDGVLATVMAARAAWPGVQVVVLGIVSPQPLADELSAVNEAERRGAEAAGVPFVDPVAGGWFTRDSSFRFTASDGEHLNNPGHARVAELFTAALTRLVAAG
ncbi:hypothetical protein GB931_08355 [Modestobacter sp. I12A-02628]|uniref:Phosphotyrosine protein phosphatase I domain-containing protein n=1 Tax=Goekera deserti TaxID=2497753 RepID=A0A7K3WEX2_9ACTN|nr:GDSL-type esterase/lipase family protein [Goekera deserti]MPQ97934.1 hypothetical protein [Goekera deserti]NDI48580.1 hypothetical protein [Goekera deserti]NEL55041.1 hypothetical protein [Goekera deserti]